MKIITLIFIGVIATFLLFNPEIINNKTIKKEKTQTIKTKKENNALSLTIGKIQKTTKENYKRITKKIIRKPKSNPEQTSKKIYINSFKKGDIVKCKLTGKRLLIIETRCEDSPFITYPICCMDENYSERWYKKEFLTY